MWIKGRDNGLSRTGVVLSDNCEKDIGINRPRAARPCKSRSISISSAFILNSVGWWRSPQDTHRCLLCLTTTSIMVHSTDSYMVCCQTEIKETDASLA